MSYVAGLARSVVWSLLAVLPVHATTAPALDADVRQIWQLLDYVGVDYGGAVANHAVVSAAEYQEMQEFVATARTRLAALPAGTEHDAHLAQADQLVAAVAAKADAVDVARQARGLADALLATYGIAVAPRAIPDLARAEALYATQCSSCHGLTGRADGPAAAALTPPPVAFTDAARARERSVFALYQVISQGVAGTAMPAFTTLSDDDRWALALRVGTLAYPPALQDEGAQLWQSTPSLRVRFLNLDAVMRSTEAELGTIVGEQPARAAMAYLRTHPEAVTAGRTSAASLVLARQRLGESQAAYASGDPARATALALSAYLDGFEPVEPSLALRNRDLLDQVERAMGEYRARIGRGASVAEVDAQACVLQSLIDAADTALNASSADATAAFLGSLTILLREGLEALLIVIAMIAFLRKAERADVLLYVHAGWVGALLAGLVTWGIATYVVGISGAGREVTEGLSSLFAAAVLLGVGIWMHQKSLAGRWQQYVREKLSAALTRRSAWFLFALAFISVYREVFETILFYIALWNENNGLALLAGLLTGIVLLGVISVVLLRYSKRLPIAQFFSWSSLLIAVLAVVLAGKGVAALQEAGWIGVRPIDGPRLALLGIYPSVQPLLAQLAVGVLAIAGFVLNRRSGSRVPSR
ncbi:high-affinity iron transporter [Tahibacter aquaticus]|uniref:High-affinity iron transporter n=1 Tax=Tahibacter aquaticus TaxID=520092 RepID=A0A4R6YL16_9GAMM|nr:cytochrome c/FTR1 family iron permease [Tahibacter aquaticus]TDR37727.1 high-affinity iron transporter [Tahibacter aquaticus]